MAFTTTFCQRLARQGNSFSKRFLTDRSFRLATLDDLNVYQKSAQTKGISAAGPMAGGYPNRAQLHPRDTEKQMVVDLSHEQGYRRGHIPNAVNLPVEKFDFTRHVDAFEGIHQEEILDTFKELGLSDANSEVILYDNSGLLASRLWWVMRYYGFRNVRVLQGGWRNYLKSGLPISEEGSTITPSTNLTLKPKRTRLLTKPSQFFVDLKNKDVQIIDARRPEAFHEYAVPGALNVPASVFMEDAQFKSVDTIVSELGRYRVDTSKRTIVYSENGLSSCVAMFGLKMVGVDKATVYDMGLNNYRKVFDDSLSDDSVDHLSR